MKWTAWGASTVLAVTALGAAISAPAGASPSKAGSLQAHVLSVSDLPAGWSVDSTPTSTPTDQGCFDALAVKPPVGTRVRVDFKEGSTTFLGETLAKGNVEVTRWTELNNELRHCHSYTATATGKAAKVSVGAMSFPKIGTRSNAYAVTVTVTSVNLGADLVLFKLGDYVGLVEYGGLGTPEVTEAERLVDLAVAKVNSSHPKATTTTTTTTVPPTTTTVPPTTTTTTTPPPPTTTPPTTAAPAGCHPISDEGGCYQPGEFCRGATHGVSGTAGDGEAITCETNDGWRWEPV